jgi:hypothetical protein
MTTATTDSDWDSISPQSITGFGGTQPGGGSGGVTPGVINSVATPESQAPPLWSPDNPLFWFGALLLAAAGFLYVSTEVKAGPFKAEASV